MQMNERAIPGVILAGGQGRRIGGRKAEVLLGGLPLWRHVERRVEPQVSVLAVNGLDVVDFDVVSDGVPGLGPLGGILAAMVWARSRGAARVLTVAVDTPFLPLDLVERMAAVEGAIVVAETQDGLHGTTAIWDVGLAASLEAALAQGVRKVTVFAQDAVAVRFAETVPPAFFNVNTAEDLAKAEAWL